MNRKRLAESFARGTEIFLWVVSALCLGATALAAMAGLGAMHSAQRFSAAKESIVTFSSADSSESGAAPPVSNPEAPAEGEVIGRIEIPEIGLRAPITAGISTSSLLRGVGHIDGTAMPGGLGTLGLGGHRDTYLRPLQKVSPGMEILIIAKTGKYHYHVDSTEIVLPEQVDVLAIRSRPELALITCYPFQFIGAAPKRFVVHAHLLSAAPD